MTRILGIDPGSRITGYGVVEMAAGRAVHVASGDVRVQGDSIAERLGRIFAAVAEVVAEYAPQEAAVEQVFVHRNADSALKLGQARGAAICALAAGGLPVSEYTPGQIKQAVVGSGRAAKDQVQHMVRALLALPEAPTADAADALAVALCHGHTGRTLARYGAAGLRLRGARRGRLR